MARNAICNKTISVEDKTCTFEFPAIDKTLTVTLVDVQSVLTQLALHGLSQKGGDAFAGEKDPEEAFNKCGEVIGRLKEGDWAKARQPGSGPSVPSGVLWWALR